MLEQGLLARCDRCGERVFFPLAKLGKTAEDNWFKGCNMYGVPKDWTYIEAKLLCPECAEEFERAFNKFMESKEQHSNILHDGDEPVKHITTIDGEQYSIVDNLKQTMVYASEHYASEQVLDRLHGTSRETS